MIRVLTREPTPRDVIKPITGIIRLKALVPQDSYLFVGTGRKTLLFDRNKLEALKKETNIEKLREFIHELSFDFEAFQSLAGNIVIHGSSIKGALRTRLELLFKSVNKACPACFRVYRVEEIPQRYLLIWGDVVREVKRPCDYLSSGRVCEICDIFGAPGLGSLVDISNFILEGNAENLEKIELITGQKVMAVKPGSIFHGKISFRNLEKYQLGLLFIGLRLGENKPILIGRFKFRKLRDARNNELKFGRLLFELEDIQLIFADEATQKLSKSPKDFVKEMISHAELKFKDYLRTNFDEVERVDRLA